MVQKANLWCKSHCCCLKETRKYKTSSVDVMEQNDRECYLCVLNLCYSPSSDLWVVIVNSVWPWFNNRKKKGNCFNGTRGSTEGAVSSDSRLDSVEKIILTHKTLPLGLEYLSLPHDCHHDAKMTMDKSFIFVVSILVNSTFVRHRSKDY